MKINRYLVIGAHPDDADLMFGGCAVKLAKTGHKVKFVSAANGDCGHQTMDRKELAARRWKEAQASAKIGGVEEYEIFDNHDCELTPSLENRFQMIRMIRRFCPDLIITCRPCDYHADHRAVSQLVQDASFLLNVPLHCADTPIMPHYPVIVFSWDDFQKPAPHAQDIAVGVDDVVETKIDMLNCHTSQFYEWLPWNKGWTDRLPPASDTEGRRRWLREGWIVRNEKQADKARAALLRKYGAAGQNIACAETFEISEYGRKPSPEDIAELFPF